MKVRVYSYYESSIYIQVIKDPDLWDRYEHFLDCRSVAYDSIELNTDEIDINDEMLSKNLTGMGY